MIIKLIFKIGQFFRNPSLNEWFLFLKGSESWSLKEIEEYQFKKLKELLIAAEDYSEYYNEKLKGVDIHQIHSLDDIKKIPILTKEELLRYNNEIHVKKVFNKLFEANTSGTSGQSLKFKRDESADSFNRASIFRGYSWYGVHPWERNGYFWGFNFSKVERIKIKVLDFFQQRFRMFSYEENNVYYFYKKLQKATYLHGYSSMIYNVAKFINEKKLPLLSKLKMVKGTSEKIYNSYQNEVEKAFGVKMISEYGAAETGIIAFECPEGNMHINMEGVIIEEVNNEIIVTNLQMISFPIIRYKLGDYIKLAPKFKKCRCGLNHLILEEVTGRIGELVYGNENTYPSLYFYYIFKNLTNKGISLTYQVLQNTKGELIFNIEQKLNDTELYEMKTEINLYFKNDISSIINVNVKHDLFNRKRKSFISKL